MRRFFGLLIVAICLGSAVPATAQDEVLTELYGQAVHAYFSGKSLEAFDLLNEAIDNGSKDPRAFYFRGLTYQQLGRDHEAADDFTQGAQLESADGDQFYNVSKALERIQGSRRVAIEKYRITARVNAVRRKRELERQRYEQIRGAEPSVTVPVPAEPEMDDQTLPEPVPEEPVTEPAEPTDETEPVMEPEAPTEEPTPPANEDPFAEPGEATPDMPAETPDEAPAEAAPAEEPPAAPVEIPAETPPADEPAPTEEPPADAVPSADELPPIEVPTEPAVPAPPATEAPATPPTAAPPAAPATPPAEAAPPAEADDPFADPPKSS